MDEKKVKEAIYCMKSFADDTVCEECDNYDRCDYTMAADNARTAIEALEKQLPKKAKENEIRGGWLGKQKHYTCPNCGNCLLTEMMNERQNTSYCWDCGQRLDWKEEWRTEE